MRAAVEGLLRFVRLHPGPEVPSLDAETTEALLPLVKYEKIAAWFGHRLQQSGQLAVMSPGVQEDTRRLGVVQVASHLRLAAVTARVVRFLGSHGIRPVLLKGVAFSALGHRYPFFRFRSTNDADLLVEPGSAERAWRLLRDNGLGRNHPTPSVHPDHHHLPTLLGDLEIPIEIHSSASLFWTEAESWSRMRGGAREVAWQGIPVLVPAPTELFWHGVVHSLGDGPPGWRLRSFLTAAALLVEGRELDWDRIGARIKQEHIREHDSRYPVPFAAVKRWLNVAAWLGGTESAGGTRDDSVLPDLTRLLDFRRRRLAAWPSNPVRQQRVEQWMEEGTRAQLGLGRSRLGHWQPRRLGPRRLLSSLVYRLLYRMAR